jgi:hypothetical protein
MSKNLQLYWENEIKPQLDPLHNTAGNLLYYVFQTPYQFQPELLIVGINPGGDYEGVPFLDRKTNWYTDCKRNTEEKYSFNETLCAVFGYEENNALYNLLENAVGTNMVFFNTGSVEKLNNNPLKTEMIKKCESIVIKLIDEYIQPKRILSIGKEPFEKLKTSQSNLVKLGNAFIHKSFRGETPLYRIPNPSRINLNSYYKSEQIKQYQQYFEQEFLNQ